MHEVEKNYRDGIKKYVLDKGVSSTFVEMPAVMERIYSVLKTKNLDDMPLAVSNGGRRIDLIGTHKFLLNEDGSVNFLYMKHTDNPLDSDSVNIVIDKYGMDQSFGDYSPVPIISDWFVESRREDDGTIKGTSASNVTNIGKNEVEDHGSPFLYLDEPGVEEKAKLKTFEENREVYEVEYPRTKEWYAEKEEQMLLRSMTPQERNDYYKKKFSTASKEEIEKDASKYLAELEEKLSKANEENRDLREALENATKRKVELESEVSKMQKMLNKSLEVVKVIKETTMGKLLLNGKFKRLDQKMAEAKADMPKAYIPKEEQDGEEK